MARRFYRRRALERSRAEALGDREARGVAVEVVEAAGAWLALGASSYWRPRSRFLALLVAAAREP